MVNPQDILVPSNIGLDPRLDCSRDVIGSFSYEDSEPDDDAVDGSESKRTPHPI